MDSNELRTLFSYDTISRTKTIERSPQDEDSLDLLLDIPCRVTLAPGCPVRVLREVDAINHCGASIMVPKMTFGTFKSVSFHATDCCLSTARVQFKIDDEVWFAEVAMVTEEFDLSDINTNGFKMFFERYSHRTFMPLSLAYAVTMTSLQGLEFDNLIFDLTDIGIWIRHVLYMGLTRVRSSRGIRCINIPSENDTSFNKNDPEIAKLYSELEKIAAKQTSCDSRRNESLLSMDFVHLFENFKVTYFNTFFLNSFSSYIFISEN